MSDLKSTVPSPGTGSKFMTPERQAHLERLGYTVSAEGEVRRHGELVGVSPDGWRMASLDAYQRARREQMAGRGAP